MHDSGIVFSSVKHWFNSHLQGWRQRVPHRLRLIETLALGERRLVAVIEFERRKFLIGGTGESLSLLADLSTRGEQISQSDTVPTWSFTPSGAGTELSRWRPE